MSLLLAMHDRIAAAEMYLSIRFIYLLLFNRGHLTKHFNKS